MNSWSNMIVHTATQSINQSINQSLNQFISQLCKIQHKLKTI